MLMTRGMVRKGIFESKSRSRERGAIWQNVHVFYFISNSISGFRLELLRGFLVFSIKVAYEVLSIILA